MRMERDQVAGVRGRRPAIVRACDIVGLLGVERYGVKIKDLAECLRKRGWGQPPGEARRASENTGRHNLS
jgi:hypothetical protein